MNLLQIEKGKLDRLLLHVINFHSDIDQVSSLDYAAKIYEKFDTNSKESNLLLSRMLVKCPLKKIPELKALEVQTKLKIQGYKLKNRLLIESLKYANFLVSLFSSIITIYLWMQVYFVDWFGDTWGVVAIFMVIGGFAIPLVGVYTFIYIRRASNKRRNWRKCVFDQYNPADIIWTPWKNPNIWPDLKAYLNVKMAQIKKEEEIPAVKLEISNIKGVVVISVMQKVWLYSLLIRTSLLISRIPCFLRKLKVKSPICTVN